MDRHTHRLWFWGAGAAVWWTILFLAPNGSWIARHDNALWGPLMLWGGPFVILALACVVIPDEKKG